MPAVRRHISLLVTLVGPAACELSLHAQNASFHIIQAGPATWGEAISADGSTVVGGVNLGGGEGQAYTSRPR